MKLKAKIFSGVLAVTSFLGCSNSKADVPVQEFKRVVTNSSSVMTVFEGERLEKGITLVYSVEMMGSKNRRTVVRELKGGADLLAKVDSLWTEGKVSRWAGFQGENPPGVLDGGGFRFDATLTDGTRFHAYGSNNYPEGYRIFNKGICDMTTKSVVDKSLFVGKYFQIKLPESWVGVVEVDYDGSGNSFYIPRDGGDVYLMNIEAYRVCPQSQKHVCLGQIKDGDEDLYLVWYSNGSSYSQKRMTQSQWNAYRDFEQNMETLRKSVEAAPGFKLEPLP